MVAVMAGAGPPPTPLFTQGKGVDADLGRHDEAARPESCSHGGLVLGLAKLVCESLSFATTFAKQRRDIRLRNSRPGENLIARFGGRLAAIRLALLFCSSHLHRPTSSSTAAPRRGSIASSRLIPVSAIRYILLCQHETDSSAQTSEDQASGATGISDATAQLPAKKDQHAGLRRPNEHQFGQADRDHPRQLPDNRLRRGRRGV